MGEHLASEGALVIFPAGEVSRLGPKGVKDGPWQSGFIKLAQRTRTPLVPIHLDGRNGLSFYLAAWLNNDWAGLLLVKQLFRQQGKRIAITIGARIPVSGVQELPAKSAARLVRSHLYRIGRGKRGLLATEAPIALPEERRQLKQAIESCEALGHTPDGQGIYLYRRHELSHSVILRELGRLREIAFRAVGEGSGRRRDLDTFDDDYHHLILWDPARLEIIGAYRFAPVAELLASKGLDGLYSHTLFGFEEKLLPRLELAIELGRSFIQPAYWGKRGLDYLWFGIGAYLARYPRYRYLFGPVSLSGSLPVAAKDLLVSFYRQHFAPELALAPLPPPLPRHTAVVCRAGLRRRSQGAQGPPRQPGLRHSHPLQAVLRAVRAGRRAVHGFWHRPRLQPLHRRPGVGGCEPPQASQAGPLYRPPRRRSAGHSCRPLSGRHNERGRPVPPSLCN